MFTSAACFKLEPFSAVALMRPWRYAVIMAMRSFGLKVMGPCRASSGVSVSDVSLPVGLSGGVSVSDASERNILRVAF